MARLLASKMSVFSLHAMSRRQILLHCRKLLLVEHIRDVRLCKSGKIPSCHLLTPRASRLKDKTNMRFWKKNFHLSLAASHPHATNSCADVQPVGSSQCLGRCLYIIWSRCRGFGSRWMTWSTEWLKKVSLRIRCMQECSQLRVSSSWKEDTRRN